MVVYFIKNVHLFDGFDKRSGTYSIVVADGRIERIAEASSIDAPIDAEVVDGEGCTLLPGLIDAHTHVFRDVETVKRAIFAGVTTVFDLHNRPVDALYMKEQSRSSSELPDIFSALYAATVDGGWPRAIVKHTVKDPKILEALADYPKLSTDESAREFVKKHKSMGADVIKLMQESGECLTLSDLPAPTRQLQEAVIQAAHDHNLLTLAHATNLRETLLVLEAGVDGMAHQFFDKPYDETIINAYRKNKAFLIPTITAISSMMGLSTAKEWASKFNTGEFLPAASRACLCDSMKISRESCSVEYAYDCIRTLKAKNVDIICGTDSGPAIHGTAFGAAVHLELELYVDKCGFTPTEALRSATGVSARRLCLADRGEIALGKRADLLLVRGDPTQRISDTTNVAKVWKAGVMCNTTAQFDNQ